MKIFRILTHSLALTGCAFVAVWLGAWLRHWAHNNYAVAVIVAPPVTVALFTIWMLLVKKLRRRRAPTGNSSEYVWIYVYSLLWGPLIFVPLHYVTQGYLTSAGNIAALFLFQAPINVLALFSAAYVLSHSTAGKDAQGSIGN